MGGLAFDCEREGADGHKGGDEEARYGEKALDLRDLPLLALCLCECPPARPLPSLSLVHPSLLPLILPSWLFLVCVWLRSKELISSCYVWVLCLQKMQMNYLGDVMGQIFDIFWAQISTTMAQLFAMALTGVKFVVTRPVIMPVALFGTGLVYGMSV